MQVGVKNLEKVLKNFVKEPEKQAEFVYGITDSVVRLGLDIITETFESMDEELRASGVRKSKWVISRRDETSLITSLGTVKYQKTLFKNKETGVCEYLHIDADEDYVALQYLERNSNSGLATTFTK